MLRDAGNRAGHVRKWQVELSSSLWTESHPRPRTNQPPPRDSRSRFEQVCLLPGALPEMISLETSDRLQAVERQIHDDRASLPGSCGDVLGEAELGCARERVEDLEQDVVLGAAVRVSIKVEDDAMPECR